MVHGRLVLALAIVCSAAACRTHWAAEALQAPIGFQAEDARRSESLTIVRRDMQLRFVRLANTAHYVAVSRDRLRFRLTLRHKWEAMSDVRTWEAWVEDATGARHELEDIEQKMVHLGFGSVSVYRGIADFTVYGRDLLAVSHRITLVLRRRGYEYRYVWRTVYDQDA